MRVCPNCRYKNDDTSDICIHCDRVMPLTAAVVPNPSPKRLADQKSAGWDLKAIGILMGSFSLAVFLVLFVLLAIPTSSDPLEQGVAHLLATACLLPFGGLLVVIAISCAVLESKRSKS
jgi:hypothetical protein